MAQLTENRSKAAHFLGLLSALENTPAPNTGSPGLADRIIENGFVANAVACSKPTSAQSGAIFEVLKKPDWSYCEGVVAVDGAQPKYQAFFVSKNGTAWIPGVEEGKRVDLCGVQFDSRKVEAILNDMPAGRFDTSGMYTKPINVEYTRDVLKSMNDTLSQGIPTFQALTPISQDKDFSRTVQTHRDILQSQMHNIPSLQMPGLDIR